MSHHAELGSPGEGTYTYTLLLAHQELSVELQDLIISHRHVRLSAKSPREPHLRNAIPLSLNNPRPGPTPMRHLGAQCRSHGAVFTFRAIPAGSPVSIFPPCLPQGVDVCYSELASEPRARCHNPSQAVRRMCCPLERPSFMHCACVLQLTRSLTQLGNMAKPSWRT